MKKILVTFLALTFLLTTAAFALEPPVMSTAPMPEVVSKLDDSTPAAPADSLKISVDGKAIEHPVLCTKDDRLMVPLRSVCEALGYTVEWDNTSKIASIAKDKMMTNVMIGVNSYFNLNDIMIKSKMATFELDCAPELIDGRTYVPYSFIPAVMKRSITQHGDAVEIGESATAQKDAKLIAIPVGGKVKIALDGNPTTGYTWMMIVSPEPLDERLVDGLILDSESVTTQTEGLPGSPSVFNWVLSGAIPGAYNVNFDYDRTFDENPPIDTVKYTVLVF